jgi:hypothetical protein
MSIIIQSIVRHVITLVAGSLLTIGVTAEQTDDLAKSVIPVVEAAALYGVAQVWSIKDKKVKKKR